MRRTMSFQPGTGYLVVAGFSDVTCSQVWPLNTLPVSLPLIECRVIRATWILQHMRYITSERDYPLNSVIQLSSPSTHNALCWSKHYRQGFWPIQVVEMLIHKPATLRWGSTIFHNPLRADSGLATLQVYLWGDRKTRQDTIVYATSIENVGCKFPFSDHSAVCMDLVDNCWSSCAALTTGSSCLPIQFLWRMSINKVFFSSSTAIPSIIQTARNSGLISTMS